jgi:hypothetical protein
MPFQATRSQSRPSEDLHPACRLCRTSRGYHRIDSVMKSNGKDLLLGKAISWGMWRGVVVAAARRWSRLSLGNPWSKVTISMVSVCIVWDDSISLPKNPSALPAWSWLCAPWWQRTRQDRSRIKCDPPPQPPRLSWPSTAWQKSEGVPKIGQPQFQCRWCNSFAGYLSSWKIGSRCTDLAEKKWLPALSRDRKVFEMKEWRRKKPMRGFASRWFG